MMKKDKNYGILFMSIFIVSIMVLSVLGFITGTGQQDQRKYNGITFYYTNGYWHFTMDGVSYQFTYFPEDLESLDMPLPTINSGMEIDATYSQEDENKEYIAQSIYTLSNVVEKKGKFLRQGFITNETPPFPKITCEDATPFVPVLYYQTSNETSVKESSNCFMINSLSGTDFVAITEKLAYSLMGVYKNG